MELFCGRFKLWTISLLLSVLLLTMFSFPAYLRFSMSELAYKHVPSDNQQIHLQKNVVDNEIIISMAKSQLLPLGKPPVLLLWTTFFGISDFACGLGIEPFKQHCNCTCELTNDKNRFLESSAIIVHPCDNIQPFPKHRLPWQHFVFFVHESPLHTPTMKSYGSVFNWTMTYRRDSDVFMPYGTLTEKKNQNKTIKNYAKGKTKLVVMVNSNCSPPSKRQNYVSHLSQYIQVDVYGACGKNHCPGKCLLIRDYKFYLSFENCICKDYITEKLWNNAFERGLVPIVLGGANYTDILPLHSFIDIADYNSPKELADYLKVVHANDTLYNSYFEWRRISEVSHSHRMKHMCDLCNKIQNNVKANVYTDLDGWWRNDSCVTPEKSILNLPNSSET